MRRLVGRHASWGRAQRHAWPPAGGPRPVALVSTRHVGIERLRGQRRGRVVRLAVWLWLFVCPPAAGAAQSTAYDQIAGELVGALEPTWDAGAGRYDPGRGGATTVVN